MHTPMRRLASLTLAAALTGGAAGPLQGCSPAPPADGAAEIGSGRHGSHQGRERAEVNRALVVGVYDRLFNEGDLTVVDEHVRPDYIQHNPQAPDGRDALRQLVAGLRGLFPDARLAIQRAIAEDDLVLVHSNLVLEPGTPGTAVFDIFRVEDGKLAEHWDVAQPVPEFTASGRSMFSTESRPRVNEPLRWASTARSRRVVRALVDQGIVGRDLGAFERYVAEDYYQHNPLFPDGREAAQQGFAFLFDQFPDYSVDVKRVIAQDDLVAVHSHYRTGPDDRGNAVVDLFRVRHGAVVEHWDVIQPVPVESANDNTMF